MCVCVCLHGVLQRIDSLLLMQLNIVKPTSRVGLVFSTVQDGLGSLRFEPCQQDEVDLIIQKEYGPTAVPCS